jgi:6-phosphogluconolactonase
MQRIDTVSRRTFLRTSVASGISLAVALRAPALSSGKSYAYVSSWTSGTPLGTGSDGGIHVFEVDPTGTLKYLSSTSPELNAGYICIAPNGRYLYSTDERTDFGHKKGAGGGIVSFSVDPLTGSLAQLNATPSMGSFPAYISINKAGSQILTSNHGGYEPVTQIAYDTSGASLRILYDDSSISLFPIGGDGVARMASDVEVLERPHPADPNDTGAAALFRTSAHAHSVNFVPRTPFALVCDKGMDRVYVYRVGESRLERVFAYDAPPRSAPRHSAFHPTRPYVFIINELQPTLSSLSIDRASGELRPISTVPTVNGEFAKVAENMCADVNVHPNGRFVYGSTRGSNSIAVVRVDEATGNLTLIDVVSSGGQTPRGFRIGPSGEFLFACNQDSGDIVTFRIDPDTGRLTPTGAKLRLSKPVCMRFLQLPA